MAGITKNKAQAEVVAWVLYLGTIYAMWALLFPDSWRAFVARFQALLSVSEALVYLTLLSPFAVRLIAAFLTKGEK